MRIDEVLKAKPDTRVATITATASVGELVTALNERNVGALVVSDDGTSVDGIVSERDVVRRLADADLLERPVADIMTREVRTCAGEDDVEDIMSVMTTHRVRHIPVVEGDRLVGIISIGDLVKSRIEQLEFERDQLDQYLHQT